MIEDDYTTYYDLLFLIELGDNAAQSSAQNWIISALTVWNKISQHWDKEMVHALDCDEKCPGGVDSFAAQEYRQALSLQNYILH